jgi:hypothetical protein
MVMIVVTTITVASIGISPMCGLHSAVCLTELPDVLNKVSLLLIETARYVWRFCFAEFVKAFEKSGRTRLIGFRQNYGDDTIRYEYHVIFADE